MAQPSADESLDDFRARVRTWFAEHVQLTGGADGGRSLEAVEAARRFQAALFDARLAGLTWPVEYDG